MLKVILRRKSVILSYFWLDFWHVQHWRVWSELALPVCLPASCPWPAVPAVRRSSAQPLPSVAREAAIRPLDFPSQSLDSCCSGTPRPSNSRSVANQCFYHSAWRFKVFLSFSNNFFIHEEGRKRHWLQAVLVDVTAVFFSLLQLQFSLEPEPVAINCTAFNHNGNLLVTGAADGVIRLFGNVFIRRERLVFVGLPMLLSDRWMIFLGNCCTFIYILLQPVLRRIHLMRPLIHCC